MIKRLYAALLVAGLSINQADACQVKHPWQHPLWHQPDPELVKPLIKPLPLPVELKPWGNPIFEAKPNQILFVIYFREPGQKKWTYHSEHPDPVRSGAILQKLKKLGYEVKEKTRK